MTTDPITAAISAAVRDAILEHRDILGQAALPRLMTFAEAASYLGIGERSMGDMVRDGRFAVVRHTEGGTRYLDRQDLERYIAERKRKAEAA